MSKKIQYMLFIMFILYNSYILTKYRTSNIKLEAINKTLLKSCTNSLVTTPESERY